MMFISQNNKSSKSIKYKVHKVRIEELSTFLPAGRHGDFRLSTKQGFVLTELLAAIAILALIMIGVSALTTNIFRLRSYNAEGMQAADELRRFMKTFVAELRSAETSDSGGYPLSLVTASGITFYSDIDNDNNREQIRYFISGTTLRKGITESSGVPPVYLSADEKIQEVIHNITNPTALFLYYPATYSGTSAPLSFPIDVLLVRLVKAEVTVDKDLNRDPGPVTDSTQVSIRNLKDNI